jgi:hypothetical protein
MNINMEKLLRNAVDAGDPFDPFVPTISDQTNTDSALDPPPDFPGDCEYMSASLKPCIA